MDAELSAYKQIAINYLLFNEDRHQENFGVVRRADTLEYVETAPIFDSCSPSRLGDIVHEVFSGSAFVDSIRSAGKKTYLHNIVKNIYRTKGLYLDAPVFVRFK